jgi:uncharacterized membrane protein YfcA
VTDLHWLLPEALGPFPAFLLIIASFFTSAFTAAFGVGGGLAMLALLGILIPVASLIPVHGVIQLGSNTGRAWHQRAEIRFAAAVPFIIGSVAGVALGAALVVQMPDAVLKTLLGLFILVVTWTKIPGFERLSHAGIAAGGAVIGILTMFVGATGPMMSAFLAQLFPGDRKALIATHAAAMTVQHGLKVVAFIIAGFAFASWLPFLAVMIATGFLGTIFGTRLLGIIPEQKFRFWFRILLTLIALDLARRGIAGLF